MGRERADGKPMKKPTIKTCRNCGVTNCKERRKLKSRKNAPQGKRCDKWVPLWDGEWT